MASRVAEVVYKLKDLFTDPAKRIGRGYTAIRRSSREAADSVSSDNLRMEGSFGKLVGALSRMRGLLAGLGSAAVATNAFKEFVDQADRVGKISQKLGVASDELTALGYAAERSNISFDTMTTALQRLIRRSAEAAKGTGEAKDALRALGIDAKAFVDLSLEDKMTALANAFRAVEDQGERVALAFKLFDTEGVDMVRVLQDGGAAMKELTDEARRLGKVLDTETTEAAAKFNDSLTKLSATATGYGYTIGGGFLKNLNDATEVFGLSADKAANLRAELQRLEAQQQGGNLNPFAWIGAVAEFTGLSDIEGDIARVRAELDGLEKAKTDQVAADTKAAASSKELRASLADEASAYKSASENAERSLKLIKDALAQETAELRRARAEQLGVEKEFQQLVDDITKPEKKDVGLGDVFGANNQARAALDKGDSEAAIKLAREGGEMLTRLKEKGTETQGTLAFLAKQLQDVANKASASSTEKEGKDVDLAKNTLATMQKQIEVMKNTAKDAGAAAGAAYAEAMQAAMSQAALQPPPVASAAPKITRNGNSFSDGTDWRREVEARGTK